MRATFLGTGTSTGVPVVTCDCAVCISSDPLNQRLRPSLLLEWDGATVLIDTSTDLRQQALRQGLRRLDAVLLTHAHADHIMGFDELRLFKRRQRGPIPVYGSVPTLAGLRRSFWYAFEDVQTGGGKPSVDLHEVVGPFPLLGRSIVPVDVLHGRLPVTGWRIGVFAYVTDVSRIPETSYDSLAGLDVLVLSALRHRPHPTHLTLAQAVEEARRIGARRTYFTHMSHDVDHAEVAASLPTGITLAHDGLVVEVADPPR